MKQESLSYMNTKVRNNMTKEQVYHPSHYNIDGKKECWDEMVERFGTQATKEFCKLNFFKYHYRHEYKNGDQDIQKAQNYKNKYLALGGTQDEFYNGMEDYKEQTNSHSAYEQYKLKWLIDHGYTLTDLMDALDSYRECIDEIGPSTITQLFRKWEQDSGFNNEIYVCEKEFQENEWLENKQ